MMELELNRFSIALRARAAEIAFHNREAIAVDTNSDLMDQIQHAAEREWALGKLERESNVIREVRAALGRIQTDTFGVCVDCGDEIALKRLAAVPWTRSCIACQETAEGGWKQPGEKQLINAA